MREDDGLAGTKAEEELMRRMIAEAVAAFSGDGPVSRGEYLRSLHRPAQVDGTRRSVEKLVRDTGKTREVASEVLRASTMDIYAAVADGAGLQPLERASLTGAIRRRLDLALCEDSEKTR